MEIAYSKNGFRRFSCDADANGLNDDCLLFSEGSSTLAWSAFRRCFCFSRCSRIICKNIDKNLNKLALIVYCSCTLLVEAFL